MKLAGGGQLIWSVRSTDRGVRCRPAAALAGQGGQVGVIVPSSHLTRQSELRWPPSRHTMELFQTVILCRVAYRALAAAGPWPHL